jgi:hypothetical protein
MGGAMGEGNRFRETTLERNTGIQELSSLEARWDEKTDTCQGLHRKRRDVRGLGMPNRHFISRGAEQSTLVCEGVVFNPNILRIQRRMEMHQRGSK